MMTQSTTTAFACGLLSPRGSTRIGRWIAQLMLGIGLVSVLGSTGARAQGLTFTLQPVTISGGNYVFDVMVNASANGTKLGDTQVYINYNTAGFGSSVAANGKILVTLGPVTDAPNYQLVNVVDNTSSRVSITTEYNFPGVSGTANDVPTTPTRLLRIEMEIADPGEAAGIGFDSALMVGQQTTYNNVAYSPIVATDVDNNVLPVELADLKAVVDGDAATISWATAVEYRSAGFGIEHRAAIPSAESDEWNSGRNGDGIEGSSWVEVAFVPGAGTSTEPRTYSYRIDGLTPGLHEFRLRSTNQDGSFTYSSSVEASILLDGPYEFSPVYPNPFADAARFALTVRTEQRVRVSLFDILGREIAILRDGPMQTNTRQLIRIESAGLPNGTYFVRVAGQTFRHAQKVVVQR